ncbi:D-hydantoinase [Streptomyces venezuelae]|nr:D-hydantoinase [Streptomyces venezuelae]
MLIEDGRIVALAAHGSDVAAGWTADRTIDATDRYVLPGGVDAHTHMELPFGGTAASDTFETGTRAAAWGGTTTIVDFAVQTVGRSLREGLDTWYAKADGNCAIDYGFHMILSDVNEHTLKEMDRLVQEGVSSFKLFMAYPGVFYSDDGRILRAMQRSADNGGLIMMHAENGIAIDVLVEQALARGETDPRYHGEVRKVLLEAEATHRAIQLARVAGAPLYVVHVSAEEAVAEIAAARDKGLPVFGETCPSTSSSPPTTSRNPASRGPSTSAPPRSAPGSTRRRSGADCGPTTSRWSPPTTAPSASRGRRTSVAGTSPRSPTACRAWRTAWTSSTRRSSRDTSPGAAGSRSPAPRPPGCSASTRRRARSRPAPTPTSSSTTRTPARPSPRAPTT